jgi:hypothetical protein
VTLLARCMAAAGGSSHLLCCWPSWGTADVLWRLQHAWGWRQVLLVFMCLTVQSRQRFRKGHASIGCVLCAFSTVLALGAMHCALQCMLCSFLNETPLGPKWTQAEIIMAHLNIGR